MEACKKHSTKIIQSIGKPFALGLPSILYSQASTENTNQLTVGDASNPAESTIRQVTLYRDQALVTREVIIPTGQGVGEFVVRGLPSHVVLNSLFAESTSGLEVRGLRISQQESVVRDPASDVSMRVESGENQLSQDGLYRRIQYPRGIMRWDLDVPAERFGEKAFDLEYTSTVEFDRNRVLTAFDANNQKRADLRELGSRPNNGSGMGGMGGGMGGNVGK